MHGEPLFSVIIPTYNRASFVGRTINSVLTQDFGDFELIVVDDGSTDNTAEVVSMIKDERLIYRKTKNGERASARNFGVTLARGTYVTFLDSDDRLYPQHLRVANENLASLNQPEVYHQGYEVADETGKVLWQVALKEALLNDLLFTRGNVMSCMGVFLKRETAQSNPFNENRALTGVEDWELWIRLAGQFSIHHRAIITGTIVQHPTRSVSELSEKKLTTRIRALMESVNEHFPPKQNRARLVKWLDANTKSYMSLHLTEIPGHKGSAFRYLLQAINAEPAVLMQRRFVAILRNILFR